MKKLNFNVPDKLAQDFKIRCVKEGRGMTDVLIELMQEYLKRPIKKMENKGEIHKRPRPVLADRTEPNQNNLDGGRYG